MVITSEIYSFPRVKAIEDGIICSLDKRFRRRNNRSYLQHGRGETWSELTEIEPGSSHYLIYDYDFTVQDDGTIHLVWSSIKESSDSYYNVFYQKSDDFGLSWDDEVQVSTTDSETSIGARVSSSGNNIYVSWEQYDSDASIYKTEFSRSTNGGESYGTPETLSGSNSVSEISLTSVSNNLVVSWIESNDNGESIVKARNSANSGSSFSTESIVGNADGATSFCGINK